MPLIEADQRIEKPIPKFERVKNSAPAQNF